MGIPFCLSFAISASVFGGAKRTHGRDELVDGWVELVIALAHAGRVGPEGVESASCSVTSLVASRRSRSPLKPGSSTCSQQQVVAQEIF